MYVYLSVYLFQERRRFYPFLARDGFFLCYTMLVWLVRARKRKDERVGLYIYHSGVSELIHEKGS